MKRSLFRPLSMILLFGCAWMTGATPGAVLDPHPPARQVLAASEGPHGAHPAADDAKDPSEEGPAGDLERELNALIEELKKLERDARKVFEEDILPRVREEIQKLREKLRDFDPEEKKQPETRET